MTNAPIFTFRDAAYTFIKPAPNTPSDTINLPSSSAGDVIFLWGYGIDGLNCDVSSALAAGWDDGGFLNPTGPHPPEEIITTAKICDGSEGATESSLFGGGSGRFRYWVAVSFTPDSSVPSLSTLLDQSTFVDPGWYPVGIATAASEGSPFSPDDMFGGATGAKYGFSDSAGTGFGIGYDFFVSPGASFTNPRFYDDTDPDWNNPPNGVWHLEYDIQDDIAVLFTWYNSTDGDLVDETSTDVLTIDSDSWSVGSSGSLTYPGFTADPSASQSLNTGVRAKWDPQTWW